MTTTSDQRGGPKTLRTKSPSGPPHGRLRIEDRTFWDRHLRARIGQDLRSIFETSLDQPLPEHLSRPLLQIQMVAREDTARPRSQKGTEGA